MRNRGEDHKRAHSAIYAEAADWLSKIDRGLTSEEEVAFEAWKSQSDFHEQALEEQQWNWEELDRLAGLHTRYGSQEDPNLLIKAHSDQKRFPGSGRWIAVFAVAACSVLSVWTVLNVNRNVEVVTELQGTEVVVERIVTRDLEDGSRIQLNRGAEVAVKFEKSRRLVKLLKGEASFDVAKDPERPFFVDVGGVQVRAVGTAFNIRYSESEVDVIVSEGIVSLRKTTEEDDALMLSETSPEEETFLEANYRARVDLQSEVFVPSVEEIEPSRLEAELMWKPVLIDFENVPLSQIVDEFNRRNPVQMVIVDQSVNNARLSSMFWSDNISGLIRLLESNFGIRATWGEDGTIYLFSDAG